MTPEENFKTKRDLVERLSILLDEIEITQSDEVFKLAESGMLKAMNELIREMRQIKLKNEF